MLTPKSGIINKMSDSNRSITEPFRASWSNNQIVIIPC